MKWNIKCRLTFCHFCCFAVHFAIPYMNSSKFLRPICSQICISEGNTDRYFVDLVLITGKDKLMCQSTVQPCESFPAAGNPQVLKILSDIKGSHSRLPLKWYFLSTGNVLFLKTLSEGVSLGIISAAGNGMRGFYLVATVESQVSLSRLGFRHSMKFWIE